MKSNVIEGFETLTKQQLFDMSAAHVLKNGKPSMQNGACSYAGIGCAAAPFLTPQARKQIRGAWGHLKGYGRVPEHESDFIQYLQNCHDDHSHPMIRERFVTNYKAAMVKLAKMFHLNTEVLEKDHA